MNLDEFEHLYRTTVDSIGNELQTVALEVANLSDYVAQLENRIAAINTKLHQINYSAEKFIQSQRTEAEEMGL